MDPAPPPYPLVLVVDDHAESREVCARLLGQAGFRVITAINGLDGLVKALSLRPDVIVMDLAMPELAASSLTREIPVIVLTAHATPEAKALAFEAGCRAFLPKPVLPERLIAEVGRWGGRPQAEGSAERSSA